MTATALLQDMLDRGVVLTAEAGRLRYRAPAGAVTPDLRRQLEAHKAGLMALLSAQTPGLFDEARAPVLTDFERARQRLAELEAEIDAGAACLANLAERQWSATVVGELNAKGRAAASLAAVAEYQSFDELEEATGRAYVAHCGNPSDPALLADYRRLDDAWTAVLELHDLRRQVEGERNEVHNG